jgi:hypothetical protein
MIGAEVEHGETGSRKSPAPHRQRR